MLNLENFINLQDADHKILIVSALSGNNLSPQSWNDAKEQLQLQQKHREHFQEETMKFANYSTLTVVKDSEAPTPRQNEGYYE